MLLFFCVDFLWMLCLECVVWELVVLKRFLLVSVCGFFVFVFSVVSGFSVGVKEGDWIEYGISFTGAPELTASSHGFEVVDVDGTVVTVRGTTHFSNGTIETEEYIVDVAVESWSKFDGFIIPSPVSDVGSFYSGEVSLGNLTVEGVEERTYAGARRNVVYTNLSRGEGTTVFYYDKNLGVLLEFDRVDPDFTLSVVAERTNMWCGEMWVFELELFFIVVFVLVVVSLIFLRRRKRVGYV